MNSIKIATFYKFVTLGDIETLQSSALLLCKERGIKGTILLASEGINGTIAGATEGVDAVLSFLRSQAPLSDLESKVSYAESLPFYRMKVCLKQEIVSFGRTLAASADQVGTYINPQRWNALISAPEVVVLDVRNDYEVDLGTFAGATNPKIESFREFSGYVEQHLDSEKHKTVAMFCTGGIRCEKASVYMVERGFERVFHLKGGILKYLEEIPSDNSLWRGECFVFDERVSLDHRLDKGSYALCRSCRHPLSANDRTSLKYKEGVFCPYCADLITAAKRSGAAERQRQVELARQRGEAHIGRYHPQDQSVKQRT